MLGCRRLLAAPLRPATLRALASRAPSPYSVLGLPATAEAREIKETFYRLSKEHHPDLSKEQGSLEKFREIAAAYEVLGCTLQPETCTLHLSPCTLHPAPCTLHHALHPALHAAPWL